MGFPPPPPPQSGKPVLGLLLFNPPSQRLFRSSAESSWRRPLPEFEFFPFWIMLNRDSRRLLLSPTLDVCPSLGIQYSARLKNPGRAPSAVL